MIIVCGELTCFTSSTSNWDEEEGRRRDKKMTRREGRGDMKHIDVYGVEHER